jgi:tRNA A-37 threonylcarbamoyl transferase component Bud32
MSLEGQQLGEFEILERLGQGGMGAVYKARQKSLRRMVALKTLQASLAEDPEYIARFEQEAVAAAGLMHPNLVQVFSAGENDGLHWFAMEYVEGESAKVRLKRKGRIDPLEAIAITIHVATALEYGWRKAALIHRDIKPDNIFLSSDGEVKLGDLGLAKSAGQTQGLTVTGHSMGTPHYISPEQVESTKDVDLRADIYSLGCTLYHMLSGQVPFDGNSAVSIMMKHVTAPVPVLKDAWPECPLVLNEVVGKMMKKNPADRQQDYAEVIGELRQAYEMVANQDAPTMVVPEPVPQPKATPLPTPAPKPRAVAAKVQPPTATKSQLPLYAAIAAVVGAIVIVCFFVFKPKEPQLTEAQRWAQDHAGDKRPANSPETAAKDAPFVNSLGMKFVPVPILSGPTAGQKVLFGVWDVRVVDYAVYAAANPKVDGAWKTQQKDGVPAGHELNHPVVGVSWEDAQGFCQWLTAKEQTEGRLPKGFSYRLPTDEEWSWDVPGHRNVNHGFRCVLGGSAR